MFEEHRKAGGNGFHPTPPVERRTCPRYHFTAAVEALDQNHRTRMNARTSDIGRGGCYVDTYCPFPLKTGVKLRLTNEKSSFMAEAKVVYSKIGMGMGLEFTSVEPQQMNVLERWIGELSGSSPMQFGGLVEHHNGTGHISAAAPHKETGYVLNELIVALMRKGTLTEEEGKTMLLRLLHRDFLP
jgi:hypothetical protein